MEQVVRLKKAGEEFVQCNGELVDFAFAYIMYNFSDTKDKQKLIKKLSKGAIIKHRDSNDKIVKKRVKGLSRASVYRYLWYRNPFGRPKKGRDVQASLEAKARIASEFGVDFFSYYDDGCLVPHVSTGFVLDVLSGEFKTSLPNVEPLQLCNVFNNWQQREKVRNIFIQIGYITSYNNYCLIQNRIVDWKMDIATKRYDKDLFILDVIRDMCRGTHSSFQVVNIAWVAWYNYDAVLPWRPYDEPLNPVLVLMKEAMQVTPKEYQEFLQGVEKKDKTKAAEKKEVKKKKTKKSKKIKALKKQIKQLQAQVELLTKQLARLKKSMKSTKKSKKSKGKQKSKARS